MSQTQELFTRFVSRQISQLVRQPPHQTSLHVVADFEISRSDSARTNNARLRVRTYIVHQKEQSFEIFIVKSLDIVNRIKKRLLIVFGNAHALSRRNGPQQVRTAAAGWPPYINELRPLSLLAVTQRSQKLSVAADTEIVQRRCFGLNKIEQKLFGRLRVQLS